MMTTTECTFCEPEAFAPRQFASNELAVAFLSDPRLAEGHSLVVPTRHVTLPSELTGPEAQAIHELVSHIHVRLLGRFAAGIDIWQKSRPQVPQNDIKMDHVHYHVLPSNLGEMRYQHSHQWGPKAFAPLEAAERDKMLALLRP